MTDANEWTGYQHTANGVLGSIIEERHALRFRDNRFGFRRESDGKSPYRAFLEAPMPPDDVIQNAACAGHENPDIFFPAPSEHQNEKAARAICQHCPVRKQCLEYALRMPPSMDFGVWGGTSERQRLQMRRARRRGTAT